MYFLEMYMYFVLRGTATAVEYLTALDTLICAIGRFELGSKCQA